MKIRRRLSLNKAMKEEIRELERTCREHDGTEGEVFLSSKYNFDRSIKCFFMCCDEEKPVAFLCLFIPSENEAEVTGFTHPDYRRKGLFTMLLALADAELSEWGIEKTVFVLEPASADGALVLAHLGAKRAASELLMAREYEEQSSMRSEVSPSLSFESVRDGAEDDIILKKSGRKIASVHVGIGESECCIFEFEVKRSERNKGYGTYILRELIERYRKRLVLQVSGDNEAAVHLYKKFDFEIVSAREYYTITP